MNETGTNTRNQAAEPYAVLSQDNTVLTFFHDSKREERNGMSIGPFNDEDDERWGGCSKTIETVVFDDTFADCPSIKSTACWFYGCSNLTTIKEIHNLKTGNVENMKQMFYGCSSLTGLDLSGFDTSNVEDMSWMFYGCSGLTSLDLSGFDAGNVEDMRGMFRGCSELANKYNLEEEDEEKLLLILSTSPKR